MTIIEAVFRGDVRAVQHAVQRGENLNVADKEGRTALMHAVLDRKIELARLLLSAGADAGIQDRKGNTALHFAAQENATEIVDLLLANGAPVDIPDQNGNTPLSNAVYYSQGAGDTIQRLLRAGADPDAANSHGVSPRTLAKSIANYDVAKFFGST